MDAIKMPVFTRMAHEEKQNARFEEGLSAPGILRQDALPYITKDDFSIRPFKSDDKFVIKRWLDKFPMPPEYREEVGCCFAEFEEEKYLDDKHYLLCLRRNGDAIGSLYLRTIEEDVSTEVVLEIGDFDYMNRKVFRAMCGCVFQHLSELCPGRQCRFFIEARSAMYLIK